MRSRRAISLSGASAAVPADSTGSPRARRRSAISAERSAGGVRCVAGGAGVGFGCGGSGAGSTGGWGGVTGGAIATGADGAVMGGGGGGVRTRGFGAGFGRGCGAGAGGGVGAASATTVGGRDSGTGVGGPASVAVSGADTSSPGDGALCVNRGNRGKRPSNAATCISNDNAIASQRTGIVMTSCRTRRSSCQAFIGSSDPVAGQPV